MIEINSTTFTDMRNAITDWHQNNKEFEHVQNVLHAYMKQNTCIDKYLVIVYKKQAWQFSTLYNDGVQQYRIITILPK